MSILPGKMSRYLHINVQTIQIIGCIKNQHGFVLHDLCLMPTINGFHTLSHHGSRQHPNEPTFPASIRCSVFVNNVL